MDDINLDMIDVQKHNRFFFLLIWFSVNFDHFHVLRVIGKYFKNNQVDHLSKCIFYLYSQQEKAVSGKWVYRTIIKFSYIPIIIRSWLTNDD